MHLAFLTLLIRELQMFLFITKQTHKLFTFIVIKLYMFWASSLPIIRSFVLYIRHW